jgi:hypothetical protein
MRILLVVLLSFVLLAPIASAEILNVPISLGAGGIGFLVTGVQDSDWGNQSGQTLTTWGGLFGFGILDNLDGYLQLGYGVPPGTSASMANLGGKLKYTVFQAHPFAMSLHGGLNAIMVDGSSTTSNDTQISIGTQISTVLFPFIPYLGATYRSIIGDNEASATDLTIGAATSLSYVGALFIEYTLQSITPKGGSSYTSGQIALGIGMILGTYDDYYDDYYWW